jgi:hypothetical protein
MWVHTLGTKLGGRFLVAVFACLVVVSLTILACRSEPSLKLLKGHSPSPHQYYADVYFLTANYEVLRREAADSLSKQGFTEKWNHHSTGGRTVGYQSKDGENEVYLVERSEAMGTVEVWVKPQKKHSRFRDFLASIGVVHHHCHSSGNACIANLKQIEGAKANWAMEGGKSTNDIPCDADLFGPQAYIRSKPTCPSGGIYTIGSVADLPTCSYPLHALQ